ncbi:MAG: tetratricopeptide repeat protein [Candidatus Omnitrophica bacterium]|nr:tetratricopeptide repeat protein [Candidatus Omnitrophota bacterium]
MRSGADTVAQRSPVHSEGGPVGSGTIGWRSGALILLLYAAVGLLVYSNSFRADFHLDDYVSIGKLGGQISVSDLWGHPNCSKRRLLPDLTLALNYRHGGMQAEGYHAVNLAVHVLASFFAFLLSWLTLNAPVFRTVPLPVSRGAVALFSGLVFLCHPLQTESVTYICQRYTSIAGFFYLAGLFLYAAYRLSRKKGFFYGALAVAGCGFLSKESFYTFPFAVLLYEVCFFREGPLVSHLSRHREWLFFLAASVLAFFVTQAGSTIVTYGQKLQDHLPRMTYLMTQGGVLVGYLGLLFLPYPQNFHWDVAIQRSFFSWPVILPLIVLLAVLGVAFFWFRKRRQIVLSFAILWFFLTLAIESSFFPLEDLMVEHRLYPTLFGFAFALVYYISTHVRSRRKYAYLSVYVALLALMTYQRNAVYATHRTLWTDVATKSPHRYRPWSQLAIDARSARDDAAAFSYALKALEVLIASYEKDPLYLQGLAIKDYEQITSILLETYAARTGAADFDALVDALYSIQREFRATTAEHVAGFRKKQAEAYELDKDYSNIAIRFAKRGIADRAETLFRKAIEINPDNPANHSNYGAFLMSQGRDAEARDAIDRALALDPTFADAKKNLAALDAKTAVTFPGPQGLASSTLDAGTGEVREASPAERALAESRKAGEGFKAAQTLRQLRQLNDLRKIPKIR